MAGPAVTHPAHPADTDHPAPHLTPREHEVVTMVVDGLTAIQIGHRLALSPRTVDNHLSRIRRRLDLPNRAALVAYAHAHGLVAGPAPTPVRPLRVVQEAPPPDDADDPDDRDDVADLDDLDAELDPRHHDIVPADAAPVPDPGPPTEPVEAIAPASVNRPPRRRVPVMTLIAATLVAVVALTATLLGRPGQAAGTAVAPPAATPTVTAPAIAPAPADPPDRAGTGMDDAAQDDAAQDDAAQYDHLRAVARAVAAQARRDDAARR